MTHVADQPLKAPLTVVVKDAQLNAYFRACGQDPVVIFSDVSAEEGAMRLLTVHLEETLLTKPVDGALLTLTEVGFTLTNAPTSASTPLPAGDYEWRREPPS